MEMQRFTIGCHDHLKGEAFLMYSHHINESGKVRICGPRVCRILCNRGWGYYCGSLPS